MISNKPYSRSERVGKQILEIISSIAIKNIDLSPLGFITFTNVDVSPDLKNAKIFYSAYKKKVSDDALYKALNKKQKAFKKFLGPELHLRSIPKIHFYSDDKFNYIQKIDRLLKEHSTHHISNDSKS